MSVSLDWLTLFNVFVLVMLALDLGIFHRKAHAIRIREALVWSALWIGLALAFCWLIYLQFGRDKALAFLAGYLVEKALSVDNLFVFLLIFSYFRVPALYQHKVLSWGILGALLMRAGFIAAGVVLIQRLHWVIYLFGAFLVYTGIRLAVEEKKEIQPERNPVLRVLRRLVPISPMYEGGKFWVRIEGRLFATPLLVVLVVVETTDILFAVDSIPAILAITTDPLIVYTSNVFAILGLRALYFALAGMLEVFHYLHYGLAAILIFVGAKMLLAESIEIPIGVALGVIAGILVLSVAASLIWRPRDKAASEPEA
jgi:tellurite resistance protein TerC